MNRAQRIQSLFEEIYGKLAIGYHRTNDRGMDALAKGQPFTLLDKDSKGEYYGRGVYLNYDIKSQEDPAMNIYGEYVIKAKVNLEKFLILNPDIGKIVYPSSPTISEQLERVFRLPRNMWTRVFTANQIQDIDFIERTETIRTDNLANSLWREPRSKAWLTRNARGKVFIGDEQEGRAIVAYDPKSVIPMGYVYSPPGVDLKGVKFRPVREYTRQAMNPSLTPSGGDYDDRSVRAPLKTLARQLKQLGISPFSTLTPNPSNNTALLSVRVKEPSDSLKFKIYDLVRQNFRGWMFGSINISQHSFNDYEMIIRAPRHIKLSKWKISSND